MVKNNWKFNHIGVLVGDTERATKYYETLGIGPFESLEGKLIPIKREIFGKPAPDVKNRLSLARIGSISIELVQPVSGISPQREFLDTKGEGINHIGFIVDDLEEETNKLVKKGFKVISSGAFSGGGGFAYFNTAGIGGFIIELFQPPPGVEL